MSTFNPVGLWPSDGMRMRVCVCVCVCVDGMNLKYALRWHVHISVYSVLCQGYTQAHTHTPILKPSEDSKLAGLKVDIADFSSKPKQVNEKQQQQNLSTVYLDFWVFVSAACHPVETWQCWFRKHSALWTRCFSHSLQNQEWTGNHYFCFLCQCSSLTPKKKKKKKRTKRQILFIRYSAKIALLFFKSQLTTFNTEKSQGYSIFFFFFKGNDLSECHFKKKDPKFVPPYLREKTKQKNKTKLTACFFARVVKQDPNTKKVKKNMDFNRATQNVCTFSG